jgi:GcrA cell cycle regulator
MIAWPEDHAAELHRLRGEKMTFTAIAEALNLKFGTAYTRSSIAGKCRKAGLSKPRVVRPKAAVPKVERPNRTSLGIGPAVQKISRTKISDKGNYSLRGAEASGLVTKLKAVQRAMEMASVMKGDGYKPKTVEVATLDIRLVDLEPGQCRFACTRVDNEWRFCGQPKKDGSSYCSDHHSLCWTPRKAPVVQLPHYRAARRRAA